MKRDPDFWFWLSAMAAIVAAYAMSLAYELNFYSEWFLGLFFVVLVLATGYTGGTLLMGRKSKAVVPAPAATEQTQGAHSGRSWGNLIRLVCIGGTFVLFQLPGDGLSRWAIAGLSIVLLGVWLWYELVGSKSEEVGR